MSWSRRRAWIGGRMPMPLWHVAPVVHDEPPSVVRRRRWVVAAVSLAGAHLLGRSLSTPPGSRRFYSATLTVAGVWAAGGLLSGPLHLGWIQGQDRQLRRPVLTPIATGAGAFVFFYGCALVAQRIPVLENAISRVLVFAREGDEQLVMLTTLANAVGEEVFFRGAVYASSDRGAVATSTIVYTAATSTTRNPALTLAAGVMGTLFGLQRRASGGLQAPVLTHLTWSALMVGILPRLFRGHRKAVPAGREVVQPTGSGYGRSRQPDQMRGG